MTTPTPAFAGHINSRSSDILQKAVGFSEATIGRVREIAAEYLRQCGFPPEDVCLIVVGSLGRREALEASDIDLIPVLKSESARTTFQSIDSGLRQKLHDVTGLKVSRGEDLTSPVSLEQLTDPLTIGGAADTSSTLTKRILILTEGVQAAGTLSIDDVRRKLMDAYSGVSRSSGRHVLSLCNDIARYYRTLCVEYKFKVDSPDSDWCVRNMKLRHSRKFWYFSCMVAIVALADSNPQGDKAYQDLLLEAFGKSPVEKLFAALKESLHGSAGRIVESFAWFLDFMSDVGRRDALKATGHEDRYAPDLGNPFPATKFNSDLLHQGTVLLIDNLPASQRDRILSWFLL